MRTYTHQGQHHPAFGTRGRERRWGALLLVALVLVSTTGTRAFGADRTCPNDSGCSLIQLTHSTPDTFSGLPSINAAGTRIAFVSVADLTGDNPDGSVELFLVNTLTKSLVQLTHSSQGNIFDDLSINAAGTRITFASDGDLTGDNPDGNSEIFLVDTLAKSLTQLTHSSPDTFSQQPSINAAGTHIAFTSSVDLTGDNPDGNEEIFLATCVGTGHDLGTMTREETGEQER